MATDRALGPLHSLDAAARRIGVAVVAWLHLWWLPGSATLVYAPGWIELLPWVGLPLALLLVLGVGRGAVASLLAVALAAGALTVAREGQDAVGLLPVLSVLAALALIGLNARVDRLAWDHWRALRHARLEDLYRAVREPVRGETPPRGQTTVRLGVALLLLVTARMVTDGPPVFDERAAALARAALAFLLAFPFGQVYTRWRRSTSLVLLYDEQCHFCTRTLQWMRPLDPAWTWVLRSESDLPEPYRGREDLDRERAMFAMEDGRAHRGHHAFRRMLSVYRFWAPLVFVLGWPGVRHLGEWVYVQVARHRGEWFACGAERED